MIHPGLADLAEPIDNVRPYPDNPRKGVVAEIAKSLRTNGQYRPIVANRRTNEVLAGNHTLAAARRLHWDHIAVHWVDVDEDTARRIVLVDNRAGDLAMYDEEALAELLRGLPDLEGTGFTEADLARLGVGDDDTWAPAPSNQRALFGAVKFTLPADEYQRWAGQLRARHGNRAVDELRRRLAL